MFLPITVPVVVKADDLATMGSLAEDAMIGMSDRAMQIYGRWAMTQRYGPRYRDMAGNTDTAGDTESQN